jgi:subtilisin family serine protease
MKYPRLLSALLLAILVFATASVGQHETAAQAVRPNVYVSESVLQAMKSGSARVIVTLNVPTGLSVADQQVSVAAAQSAVLNALRPQTYTLVAQYRNIAAMSMDIQSDSLDMLRNAPGVKAINLDQTRYMTDAESDALTQAPAVQASGFTGQGVRVAVIDSGINGAHTSLVDDLFAQACFRTENDCPGGPTVAQDQDGHGTHVSGTITGANGVARDAEIIALKVFTLSDTSDTNILNALDAIVTNDATWQTNIVNMSLGGDNYADQASCDANSAAYVSAFAQLNGLGISVFVATGNDAMITEVSSPGCVTGAIGVGSVSDSVFTATFQNCTENGQADKVTCFSNATATQGVGELVDVLAPGCIITAEWVGSPTAVDSICGTSMATPTAAGVAALLLSYDPSLTPIEIEDLLENTGDPVVDYRSSVSYPRVDAYAAFASLAVTLDTPANLTATGTSTTQIDLAWEDVTGETDYNIQRSTDGSVWSNLTNVSADVLVYSDMTAPCGPVFYRVRALDSVNTQFSEFSNVASTAVRLCPATPSDLTAAVLSVSSVQLDWTDNATGESNYLVERSANGEAWVQIASLGVDTETYTDSGFPCASYSYRVRAFDAVADDYSAFSNVALANPCAPANDLIENATAVSGSMLDEITTIRYSTTSAGDPAPSCRFQGANPGSNSVWYTLNLAQAASVSIDTVSSTIDNGDPNFNDTMIAVYTGAPGSLTQVACNDDVSDSNFLSQLSNFNAAAGTTYYVYVARWSAVPMSWDGVLRVNFVFAEAPPTLTATSAAGGVDLSWTSVASATEYRVERKPLLTGSFAQIAVVTVPDLTYTDTSLACNVYQYRVRAYNSGTATFGVYSNLVSAEPQGCNLIPSNDEWAAADVASAFPYTDVTPGVRFATTNTNDPQTTTMGDCTLGFPRRGTHSVWYTVTPSSNGLLDINTNGSLAGTTPVDTFISVFSGSYGAFTQLACDDESGNGSNSQLTGIPVTGGVTYSIYVARYSATATTGNSAYTVNIDFTSTVTPPGAFDLSAPAHNSTHMMSALPAALSWTASAGADSYSLTVNNGTIDIISHSGLTGTSHTFTSPELALMTVGTYTWTVSAVNTDGTVVASNAPFSFILAADPAVTVAPTTVNATEGGATGAYTVVLATEPTADVTISITVDAQVTTDVVSATFTIANWNTPQTVTVTAVDDAVVEGAHTSTITHAATSTDVGYNGISVSSVTANITDNDSAAPVNVLNNPSFEVADPSVPGRAQGWNGINLRSSDRLRCTGPTVDGTCSFRFSATIPQRRVLRQNFTAPAWAEIGDTLTLTGHMRGVNVTGGSRMMLRVIYTDGTIETVRVGPALGTSPYTLYTVSLEVEKDVASVIVILKTENSIGNLWFDNLSLTSTPGGSGRGLIEMPEVPGQ